MKHMDCSLSPSKKSLLFLQRHHPSLRTEYMHCTPCSEIQYYPRHNYNLWLERTVACTTQSSHCHLPLKPVFQNCSAQFDPIIWNENKLAWSYSDLQPNIEQYLREVKEEGGEIAALAVNISWRSRRIRWRSLGRRTLPSGRFFPMLAKSGTRGFLEVSKLAVEGSWVSSGEKEGGFPFDGTATDLTFRVSALMGVSWKNIWNQS